VAVIYTITKGKIRYGLVSAVMISRYYSLSAVIILFLWIMYHVWTVS